MVRLAADLHGRPAGELYPAWLEHELARARAQSLSLVGSSRFETFTGDPGRALLVAFEAHELHPSRETEHALRDAYRVTVLHHENRREAAQITGSGPSYLAGRWKQGAVFSKPSPDGRYHVMVTERGKDGPNPPGDVFLISNETMRVAKLPPPDGENARVEDVAFDRESRCVIVTRYFHLHVYDLHGRQVARYPVERHTKSPVHIVAGFFAGKYVFAGETKGGLWLVEPNRRGGEYLQIHREFHNDPTVAIDIAQDGRTAAVVVQSGRALLVRMNEAGKPETRALPGADFQFAGFPFRSSDVVGAATRSGVVKTFAVAGLELTLLSESAAFGASLDWISGGADGRRMLAVGDSDSLFVLDAESGELLRTLEYAKDIDWASVRAKPLQNVERRSADAAPLRGAVPLGSAELTAVDVVGLCGDQWLLVEDFRENEYWPARTAWRVDGDQATPLTEWYLEVRAHGSLMWFGNGKCLRKTATGLSRVPGGDAYVASMTMDGERAWFATWNGLYSQDGARTIFHGPEGTRFDYIKRVGERLWAWGTGTGAHALEPSAEGERIIPMGDPFGPVRDVVEVVGAAWIVLDKKPAYRVEGGRARPVLANVAVNSVFAAGGHTWLAGENALWRLDERSSNEVAGFASSIAHTISLGRYILVTTRATVMFGSAGPAYFVDTETLEVQRAGDLPSVSALTCGPHLLLASEPEIAWVVAPGPSAPRQYARVRDGRVEPLDFGAVEVTAPVTVGGQGWFLTQAGPYRMAEDGLQKLAAITEPVHDAVDAAGAIWFLGEHAAWQVEAGEIHNADVQKTGTEKTRAQRYTTGSHKPVKVVQAGGQLWIVTQSAIAQMGPLYHIAGKRAVRVRGAGEGVAGVAEIGGRIWLLRRDGVKPAPMAPLPAL
jgi:hypothetical protein